MSSKHLQMIISNFIPANKPPPSTQLLVGIGNEDKLSCEVSTPLDWKKNDKTIVLIHGLGGSHESRYMVRIAAKMYDKGNKVVRINLRGCGSGKGLSKRPYSAGTSEDILKVLLVLKNVAPDSEIIVIGFSLGGNIALKLAGELGLDAVHLIKAVFAICPPFDLEQTVLAIQQRKYWLYHRYYLQKILEQTTPWTTQKFPSIYEFDDKITAPAWGFAGAKDYYQKCSSKNFLSKIRVTSHIICAEDDPFVSLNALKDITLSNQVQIWTTKYGSHMGFLGKTDKPWKFQWIDYLLENWIADLSKAN
jgi:hypothetical protein